jgi:hypothetical protein
MMRPMAMRWTRTAIAHFPKIVDRLLHFVVSGESEEIPFPRKGIAPANVEIGGAALLALSR